MSVVHEWSESSLRQQQQHQEQQRQLQAQRIAAAAAAAPTTSSSAAGAGALPTISVPTLPHEVRDALRQMGLPVRLFGENLANIRDRLRLALAMRQQQLVQHDGDKSTSAAGTGVKREEKEEEEEEVTKYTRASAALVDARQQMAQFSLERARMRMERERRLRTEAKKRKASGGSRDSGSGRVSGVLGVADKDDSTKTRMICDDEESSSSELCLEGLDKQAAKTFKQLRHLALEGSQYCDHRALSSLKVVHVSAQNGASSEGGGGGGGGGGSKVPLIIAASWTASLHLFHQGLECVGKKTQCHEDRIMGMDATTTTTTTTKSTTLKGEEVLIATASLDKMAKLFKVELQQQSGDTDGVDDDSIMQTDEETPTAAKTSVAAEEQHAEAVNMNPRATRTSHDATITEVCVFKGHAARLCRVAFHPMNQHVATTSFDHTWRLWDIETAECLLLQDGHAKECYGIGFHPDGSLVSTTDLGGIVHLWDLRVGKSIAWYRSHAGKVLNSEFHPNGFHMATAGEDGCIHIWDLRRRAGGGARRGGGNKQNNNNYYNSNNPQQSSSPMFSIPAHNNIVTKLKFDPSGEYLCSSSFDGLVKLWSCRTWKLVNQLRGHEGKVTGVDILGEEGGVITSGFDKTIKLWR